MQATASSSQKMGRKSPQLFTLSLLRLGVTPSAHYEPSMRRVLGVRLSEEAIQGWENWAARQGLTLAALLEALGLTLENDKRGFDELPEYMQRTVRKAHEIQRERRRRR